MSAARIVLALLLVVVGVRAQAEPRLPEVLFVTQSSGFVHGVVRRPAPDRLAHAERELQRAAAGRFSVTCTQDVTDITAERLRGLAAVVFYTTGELPLSEASRNALFAWIREGGAFVGVHCATDTWYRVPAYGELIGGYFDGHPWHQSVGVRVENRHHPATRHLGARFEIRDEIYQFKSFDRSRVHVLLSLDPASVKIDKGKRKDRDYALAWCRPFGRGRVFYSALGHRPEVWKDARFSRHLVEGIAWAARLPEPVPEDAEVLFNGREVDAWQHPKGAAPRWKVEGGVLEVVPRSGSIQTKKRYRDFHFHVEFWLPPSDKKGQARSNSGVYLQRRYEVQILDSFGQPARANGCGGLYRRKAPDLNACDPPETWQAYDIHFRSPRWKGDEKVENARLTVVHNGRLIHDDVSVPGKTGAGRPEGPEPGPILLQDHGNPVRFRNVWIRTP